MRNSRARMALAIITGALLYLSACGRESDRPVTNRSADETAAPAVIFQQIENAQTAAPSGGECNIETLNGLPDGPEPLEVANAAQLVLAGWAFDATTKQPAERLSAVLVPTGRGEGATYVAGSHRVVRRDDVASHFQASSVTNAGFTIAGSLTSVSPGYYDVVLRMETGGQARLCDNGRRIVVLGADGVPPPPPQIEGAEPVQATRFVTDSGEDTGKKLPRGSCNMEAFNGTAIPAGPMQISKKEPFLLSGWAFDASTQRPAKRIAAVLRSEADEAVAFSAAAGRVMQRPDVAASFQVPALAQSGFEVNGSLEDVPPGPYSLVLRIEGEKRVSLCDHGRKVVVLE
jgi:hypothetical protein